MVEENFFAYMLRRSFQSVLRCLSNHDFQC